MAFRKTIEPIIIKKIRPLHPTIHGSSTWKIALADFMTAMFIIFLLLWLVNQTTPDVRQGVAQYFAPRSLSSNAQGDAGPLNGRGLTVGALPTPASPLGIPNGGGRSVPNMGEGETEVVGHPGALAVPTARLVEPGVAAREQADAVSRRIRQALQETPELRAYEQHLQIDPTRAGVRIQLIDTQRQELFSSGDAQPAAALQSLMKIVAQVVAGVPNAIEITGHTDAVVMKRRDYSNWELSSDRAHAARRLLSAYGVEEERFALVAGVADRAPLDPTHPTAPQNRRVSILLLTENPVGGQAGGTMAQPSPGPAPVGRLIER